MARIFMSAVVAMALRPDASAAQGKIARGGQPPASMIEGEFLGLGLHCPQFRLSDGEEISLERLPVSLSELRPGMRLRLGGMFARASRCMQGRAFLAQTIEYL